MPGNFRPDPAKKEFQDSSHHIRIPFAKGRPNTVTIGNLY